MKITEFLNQRALNLDLAATNKKGIITELVDLLISSGSLASKERSDVIKILLERESLGSTGIGQGVAIPHGKTKSVKSLVSAFGVSHKGVDFDSLDGEPAYIFFLLLAPKESTGPHLKALAKISQLLRDKFVRAALKECKDKKNFMEILSREEQRKNG